MKMNNFRGELTDISAEKEALFRRGCPFAAQTVCVVSVFESRGSHLED